jgi:predicted RNase H-like HicB family nuclease
MEETAWTCPLMIATKSMYVAVAMEWYVVAQGDTQKEATQGLEHLLMGYAAIYREHHAKNTPFIPPKPAPEDYQRVVTSGDHYTNPDPKWAEFCGADSWPIVGRGVIDMAQSGMRLVPRKSHD